MCLSQVKPIKIKNFVGYKVFLLNDKDNFEGPYYNTEKNGYKVHKWYEAEKGKDTDNFGNLYETGFHIFLTREAAREYRQRFNWGTGYKSFKIKKVKFKSLITTGKQTAAGKQYDCVVAKKMLIMRDTV